MVGEHFEGYLESEPESERQQEAQEQQCPVDRLFVPDVEDHHNQCGQQRKYERKSRDRKKVDDDRAKGCIFEDEPRLECEINNIL